MEALKKLYIPLNLRIFDNTQTTLLNATGNDLSPEMKTYYEDRLIDNAEPDLVYDQFGDDYPIPKNGGKTIEFRKYDPLPKALTPLTEGVTPHGNKLNVTTITATINQYGDYIEMSDLLELTAIDRNVEVSTKLLGGQSGRTLDTVTREIVTAGTNKMFAPSVAADGTETEILLRQDVTTLCQLTPKVMRKAVAKLKRMNAKPIDDMFVAVIHPDVTCDITGNDEWLEAVKYGDPERIYKGEIGRLHNVRYVESTEAKIIGPAVISDNLCRLTVKTAISSSTTSVVINEVLTAATPSEAIPVWINGVANTITAIATSNGVTTLTVGTAITSLAAGKLICGTGAGKDGTAIYCTMLIALNAYGKTAVKGGGLEFIVKQRGSAGTADPLNQRSTVGWKATKTAERLVEAYMVRVEHSSAAFGASAESN